MKAAKAAIMVVGLALSSARVEFLLPANPRLVRIVGTVAGLARLGLDSPPKVLEKSGRGETGVVTRH
jgi:hypothetical protein